MWRDRFLTAVVVVGLLAVLEVARDWKRGASGSRGLVAIIWSSAIVISALVVLLVFTREELTVTGGRLTRRNLLGIPKSYPLDTIGGMARRDVIFTLVRHPTRYVVVYDTQHRCLFKMNRVIWDPTDVRRLHALVGGDGRTQLVTMSELEQEFRGSVAWLITHPWVLVILETVVISSVIVGLVIVQDALTNR